MGSYVIPVELSADQAIDVSLGNAVVPISGEIYFDELENRPMYNGEEMTSETDIPEVRDIGLSVFDGIINCTWEE